MRVWAAGHLLKAREVTRSGPYRFVAHPLYLGSSLIGVGLAIGSGSTVVVTSRLTEVNGNKLVFEVTCHLAEKLIGSGTHKRAIVPSMG